MNYEEWSKSIKLDQTVTPNFAAAELQWNKREDGFYHGDTEVTEKNSNVGISENCSSFENLHLSNPTV